MKIHNITKINRRIQNTQPYVQRYKFEPKECEKICDKRNSRKSSKLQIIYFSSNNDRHHATKTFIPLRYTCRHFTFSNLNFTQLHFTTFSFGLNPLTFPTAAFHLTSLHFSSLHFTALLDDFRHTAIPSPSPRL